MMCIFSGLYLVRYYVYCRPAFVLLCGYLRFPFLILISSFRGLSLVMFHSTRRFCLAFPNSLAIGSLSTSYSLSRYSSSPHRDALLRNVTLMYILPNSLFRL